jgi:hypothetical protein
MGVPRGEALTANGHSGEDDPLTAALLRQRAVQASRIDDGAARMVEAQADLDRRRLEVDARRLELEEAQAEAKLTAIRADLRKLAAESGEGARGADPGLQALLQFVQTHQEQARADREALMGVLMEQLEANRQQGSAPEPPPSPTVAEQIQQLVALRGAMAELFPPSPPAPGVNPHQMIELRKMELDVEFQRARLAEEARERQAQAALREREAAARLEIERGRVDADRQRNEQMAGLIERLGPAALAALSQRFTSQEPAQGGGGPPATTNGQPADMEHMGEIACPSCSGHFLVRKGTTAAACPHCHQYLDLHAAWSNAG